MNEKLRNFLTIMSNAFEDNRQFEHYAKRKDCSFDISTMPVTAFVYNFFIYNSLYSIDWSKSIDSTEIILHGDSNREGRKQNQFDLFTNKIAKINTYKSIYMSSFSPIVNIDLTGKWTAITPDTNISIQDGLRYFNKMTLLCKRIIDYEERGEIALGVFFDLITECRYYIYMVRNNIFHGTKHLGEIWDLDQRKRIEVYNSFHGCPVV